MLHKLLALVLFFPLALAAGDLSKLERQVYKELELLDYPSHSWRPENSEVCDVAIIGAGQAGVAVAYALKLEGIENVQLFDGAKKGLEGPWLTTARMNTLRSAKQLRGPCLGIAHLSFRAWYEAKYGQKAWKSLGKIPTKLWGKYLQWMRRVLNMSVNSECKLQMIEPNSDTTMTLIFEGGKKVRARQVVLATGRAGFGGFEIPSFVQEMPKKFWAHTGEVIKNKCYKNKRIAVLGVGASAFDAAAAGLENGAQKVDMLMRRAEIPTNVFANFAYAGFQHGYYYLPDKERTEIFTHAIEAGIPPPIESIQRVESNPNFSLRSNTQIERIEVENDAICIYTNNGPQTYDFLILATGYAVDASRLPELASFADNILLWRDVVDGISTKLGRFPYLGQHFEFVERCHGANPYLSNIYCFNYGAFLSHGRISGDIDCIDVGIKRLVEGIAIKLFLIETSLNEQVPSNVCPGTCQVDLEKHCESK